MRHTCVLFVMVCGCVDPSVQPVSRIQQGHFASGSAGMGYDTSDDGTRAVARLYDPVTTAVIATSTVSSGQDEAGSVTFAGASAYQWSGDPSTQDLAAIDAFAAAHGAELIGMIRELHTQHAVDAGDPVALRRFAALVQLAQALVVLRGESLPGLDPWLASLPEMPEVTGPITDVLWRVTLESSTLLFPIVPGVFPFWGGVAPAAGPAPALTNEWKCKGSKYEAGCRGMCGPSCGKPSSVVKQCIDGVSYLITTYTGVTNVCCMLHDAGYDACSAKYNCGQGWCSKTITVRGRSITIRVRCSWLVESCRRGHDAGCLACAALFGYQPTDCALWAAGGGPGTPITFTDTVKIGVCCRNCMTKASAPGASSTGPVEEDCVCEEEDDATPTSTSLF
jgi:hypothetical protein